MTKFCGKDCENRAVVDFRDLKNVASDAKELGEKTPADIIRLGAAAGLSDSELTGEGTTGLGKPLKLITHPHHDIPIYLASIGPKNVALTAEIADGWLPIFYSPEHPEFQESLDKGFAASGDPNRRSKFTIAPGVQAMVDEDFSAARNAMKPGLALYIGGMGAKGRNFYHTLASRYGFEEQADKIQDAFLDGKRMAAVAEVPDELVDLVCIAGPPGHVKERLAAWQESGVDLLNVSTNDIGTVRAIAELV